MTNDHPTTPMWVLLHRDPASDTLIVICHWHNEPSEDSIAYMKDDHSLPGDYFLTYIGRQNYV